jgi:uncharacterized membrane protein (DUF485 family)
MSVVRSAVTAPSAEVSRARSAERLELLLGRQRILAWALAILTLTMTVGFFATMTLAAPLMARVAVGHSITTANVAAALIILVFLASISLFGWHASRVDGLLHETDGGHDAPPPARGP